MSHVFNRYSHDSQAVGGGAPVWVRIPEKRVGGWLLENKLRDFEVLASGSPVEYDYKTHKAKILKCFEVVSSSDGNIVLKKTARTPMLYAGMNVMVAPSSITGTGTAVTLTSAMISETEDSYILASSGLTASAGAFIVEAEDAGSSKKMYAIPTDLTIDDTVGGDQNSGGIASGIKVLYENMIPAMPAIVKKNIPFVQFEWFPEEITE